MHTQRCAIACVCECVCACVCVCERERERERVRERVRWVEKVNATEKGLKCCNLISFISLIRDSEHNMIEISFSHISKCAFAHTMILNS